MIKFRYIIIFFLGTCWWNLSSSAEHQITGLVRDAVTRQPLKGANVYLSISKRGTVSDSRGSFTLEISQTDSLDSLIITFMGYKSYKQPISTIEEKFEIFLRPVSLDYGEEIVIRAEREHIIRHDIPQSITKIELAEIARQGSSEISDILKPLPAIHIEGNDLDGRRIYIRGSNSDEVNVYLDGVLINNLRFDNSANLSIVPVENIENLEIFKGGNSAFLGNGAFGGVVNISTQVPEKSGVLLKGKIGSFESEYLLGNASLMVSKKMGLSYFGQFHSFSPEIEYFADERYSDKTSSKQITTQRQNHLLTMNYFTTHGQYLARFLTYFTSYRKPFWKNDDQNFLSVFNYTGEILGSSDFSLNINHFYTRHQVGRQPDNVLEYANKYFTNRLNFNAAKKFSYRQTEIQLYGEYLHDDLKNETHIRGSNFTSRLTEEYFYDNKITASAVFAFSDYLDRLPVLSWKTYLGLRGDMVASGHKDVSPTVGAKLEYHSTRWEISPYLNYGKNVKYPTLIQNAYLREAYNLSSSNTTPDHLKPEYSNSAEIGLQLSYNCGSPLLNHLTFRFEFFHSSVYNKLLHRSIEPDLAFGQIGRNVTRGFESSLKLDEMWKRFFLTFSIMKLDVSDPLFYSFKPEQSMSVNLNFISPIGFYLNSTLFYEGSSIAWYLDTNDQIKTERLPSFYDLDLTVGVKVTIYKTEFEWQFAGYNIFDNSGYTYYYLKKRYLQFSLAIRL